jgi:hypothetical protein
MKIPERIKKAILGVLGLALVCGGWFLYDNLYTENAVPFLNVDGRHHWASLKYDGLYDLVTNCVLGSAVINDDVGEDIKLAPRIFSKPKVSGPTDGEFDLEVRGSKGEGRLKLHAGINPFTGVPTCSGDWAYHGQWTALNFKVTFYKD